MIPIKINTLVRDISSPPIVKLYEMATPYRQSGQLLDLSQAVPSYGPPAVILDEMISSLAERDIHRYTADPGTESLRFAIAQKLRVFNDVQAEAGNVIVTAGANQAYLMTVMTLLDPGDEMLLLTPYYFNHHMAVAMIGAVPVEVPLDYEKGFVMEPERVLEMITPRTRAITIVSPSNPTGTVYPQETLALLADLLKDTGIMVISDETYEYFTPGPFTEGHFSIGAIPEMAQRTFTISSFSKAFGITGWRVGYVTAPREYVGDMLKVHDTMVICAPHVSQRAALAGLTGGMKWLARRVEEMNEKLEWLKTWNFSGGRFQISSSGAFFAYLRHRFDGDSFRVTERLLKEKQVLLIPGQVFGSGQEKFVRVALGGVDKKGLKEAMERIDSLR